MAFFVFEEDTPELVQTFRQLAITVGQGDNVIEG
jgi:hypothetical protein